MMLSFTLIGCLLICLYLYFTRHFNYWRDRKIPFAKPTPFFGNIKNTLLLKQSIGELLTEFYRKTTAPVYGFFLFDQPCLLINDPNIIKHVLINDFQYFFDRVATDNKKDDPIGSNVLFILKNPDWKEMRMKITPIFTPTKMKRMSILVRESAENLINYIHHSIKTNPVIEVKTVFLKFAIDIITSAVFGVDGQSFKDENFQFNVIANKILDWNDLSVSIPRRCYFLAPTLVKLFKMKFLHGDSVEFFKTSFHEIMDLRKKSGQKRNDLIDILIELKNEDPSFELAGDKLVSQAIQFLVAGSETSSSTMTFVISELAFNPDIQRKLRKEIVTVVEKYGEINYEALKEMSYLDMCIKETLRKYPVLPFLDRRCNTNYKIQELNLTIEKNTPVFIPVMALHYNPKYFPDPEKFDPERFSKDNYNAKNFTYLPFGEGPRNCIGARFGLMNTKFGIANILMRFHVELYAETKKTLKFNPKAFLLSTIDGAPLKFSALEKTSEKT